MQKTFHIYGSTAATWATTTETRDLGQLIKLLTLDKMPFSLWYVPLPHDADYEIRMYAPNVEGAIYLGTVQPEQTKQRTKTMAELEAESTDGFRND
jgi:hypothetical protein